MGYQKTNKGFTIVELLIVVVVIGILAAITIVSYNGIQNRAKSASIQSDLSDAVKVLAIDKELSNTGDFPASLDSANGGKGIKASNGATYQYRVVNDTNPKTFCITETIGSTSYYVDQGGSVKEGACAGHGAGGVVAITNYDTSPTLSSGGFYIPGGTNSAVVTGGPVANAAKYERISYSAPGTVYMAYVCSNGNDIFNDNSIGSKVDSGQQYTSSVYMRPSWSGTGMLIRLRTYDAAGNYLGLSAVGPTTTSDASGSWRRISYTYTVAANVVGVQTCAYFALPSSALPPANSTMDVAGFMITKGSTLYGYADGSSPGWAWNGYAGQSTSSGPPLP